MQPWNVQQARAEAMLKWEGGDVPGARTALDLLIGQMTPPPAGLKYELGQTYVSRASVARTENDWDTALGDLEAAARLAAELPLLARKPLLTQIYHLKAKILATSYSHAYDLSRARSALEELRKLKPDTWIVEELDSDIAFRDGDWQRAATAALRAASMLEADAWPRGAAACRGRAGEALLALRRFDEAKIQLNAAFDFFVRHGPPDLLSATRMGLARLNSHLSEHDNAWLLAQQVLDEVESRVRRFVDVARQQRFLLGKLVFYDEAFEIGLAAGGDIGRIRAWTVAERSKSFYLAHLLANADIGLFDGVDPQLVNTLETLELEMDRCERALGDLPAEGHGSGRGAELESRLGELSHQRSATLQSIMTSNPRWAMLRNPLPFDAADALRRLSSEITPLSFFWRDGPSGSILHVFSRAASGVPISVTVDWNAGQLDQLKRYADRLHDHVDDYQDLLPDGITERILPDELLRQLPAGGCLTISAHGRLRGLPLHALPLDETHLIARWPVQYVPSLALPAPERRTRDEPVLLVGSPLNAFRDLPLPDVESELADLAQVWTNARRPFVSKVVEPDATLEDAGCPPARWSTFDILHFACHGRFFEGRPFDSELRLGRDAVRASKLFNMQLNASVVALSACSLGQRAERIENTEVVSEEWIGLYLPLFYAGARSLVVSLWDANSQVARQFMVALHQALACGEKPYKAFQTAMLRVHLKLPARWANWCLVGLPLQGGEAVVAESGTGS
jgi:CHAT domain-containing protein